MNVDLIQMQDSLADPLSSKTKTSGLGVLYFSILVRQGPKAPDPPGRQRPAQVHSRLHLLHPRSRRPRCPANHLHRKSLEIGSRDLLKNSTCVLSSHVDEGKSSIAHFTVTSSKQRIRRLRWLTPADATMSSKCSWRSPDEPAADKGARRTTGMLGALSKSLPACRISRRAFKKLPPPQEKD